MLLVFGFVENLAGSLLSLNTQIHKYKLQLVEVSGYIYSDIPDFTVQHLTYYTRIF